ncbi:MAG: carboxymuconolactone decarboxylase family protein [Actinomycetota bacterium]|nr:carboxymuconolactone decarboxylase family protein [Actinomycetota bacterium]
MARIKPAEPRGLDPLRRLIFASAQRMYGRALEPTEIVAHHRPLLAGYGALTLASTRFAHSVADRHKELAMLRTAQLIGCEWCLDFGSMLAREAGIPEADLRELSQWRHSSRFDELQRLVLEYAEAMTRTPVEVSEELFGSLQGHFDERQLVELTMAIALENLHARSNWALGIESEGFSEGTYCVRPEAELAGNLASR